MKADLPPSAESSGRMDRILIAIVVFALLIRCAWALYLPTDPASLARLPDQNEYLELGTNLAAGAGLQCVDLRFHDLVLAYRAPGYPALVALCRGNLRAIRLVQACLDTSSVLAVYLLTLRCATRPAARVAALGTAFNPFLVYFSGLILSETLFTALLIWGMAQLISRPSRIQLGWWIGAALLAGSVLVRPSAIGLPLTLGITSAFLNPGARRPYDWRWVPPVGTLMVAFTAAALLPWMWRNHQRLGEWVITTNSGITLYDGNHPDATGASDQRFVQQMPQLKLMSEVARSRYLQNQALAFMKDQPARALQLALVKIGRTWSPIPLSDEFGRDWRIVGIALIYMVPLYALIVLALWIAPVSGAVRAYLLTPAAYFTLAHALTVGSLRYRIPADVPLAALAAIGLHMAWLRSRNRTNA